MKVSLYIPCFNAASYIEHCLKAVIRQTYPIEEILVIDDGSTDETVQIASQFPVEIIRHPSTKGLTVARNTALKRARYDFLASLDVDCIPEEGWLENLMRNFSPGVAGVGGRLVESYIDRIADQWRAVHMAQEWGKIRSDSVPFLFGSNNVFRKKILLELGGYNESYRNNYEDVDISRRLRQAGYTLIYEPKALVYHARRDNLFSLFNTFWNWNFEYHREEGYYRDWEGLYLKLKENIGLSNRFLEEDYSNKRSELLYLDFFLPSYLSLKDFLFLDSQGASSASSEELPGWLLYLDLLDLAFFYHLDSPRDSLRTFIPSCYKFLQNLFAFLILMGNILEDKFNTLFLKTNFMHLLRNFIKAKKKNLEFLSNKILLMLNLHKDWSGFLNKAQPNLERQFLGTFSMYFGEWLNRLSYQIPGILRLFEISQDRMVKEEGI
jgi:glycosyltransferase involved in cell wall biosynthesis